MGCLISICGEFVAVRTEGEGVCPTDAAKRVRIDVPFQGSSASMISEYALQG